MRARRTNLGNEGIGWASWLGITAMLVCVLGAVGLAVYGGMIQPPVRHYEQVVPDDHLPH